MRSYLAIVATIAACVWAEPAATGATAAVAASTGVPASSAATDPSGAFGCMVCRLAIGKLVSREWDLADGATPLCAVFHDARQEPCKDFVKSHLAEVLFAVAERTGALDGSSVQECESRGFCRPASERNATSRFAEAHVQLSAAEPGDGADGVDGAGGPAGDGGGLGDAAAKAAKAADATVKAAAQRLGEQQKKADAAIDEMLNQADRAREGTVSATAEDAESGGADRAGDEAPGTDESATGDDPAKESADASLADASRETAVRAAASELAEESTESIAPAGTSASLTVPVNGRTVPISIHTPDEEVGEEETEAPDDGSAESTAWQLLVHGPTGSRVNAEHYPITDLMSNEPLSTDDAVMTGTSLFMRQSGGAPDLPVSGLDDVQSRYDAARDVSKSSHDSIPSLLGLAGVVDLKGTPEELMDSLNQLRRYMPDRTPFPALNAVPGINLIGASFCPLRLETLEPLFEWKVTANPNDAAWRSPRLSDTSIPYGVTQKITPSFETEQTVSVVGSESELESTIHKTFETGVNQGVGSLNPRIQESKLRLHEDMLIVSRQEVQTHTLELGRSGWIDNSLRGGFANALQRDLPNYCSSADEPLDLWTARISTVPVRSIATIVAPQIEGLKYRLVTLLGAERAERAKSALVILAGEIALVFDDFLSGVERSASEASGGSEMTKQERAAKREDRVTSMMKTLKSVVSSTLENVLYPDVDKGQLDSLAEVVVNGGKQVISLLGQENAAAAITAEARRLEEERIQHTAERLPEEPAGGKDATQGGKNDPMVIATRGMSLCFDILKSDLGTVGKGAAGGEVPFDTAFAERIADEAYNAFMLRQSEPWETSADNTIIQEGPDGGKAEAARPQSFARRDLNEGLQHRMATFAQQVVSVPSAMLKSRVMDELRAKNLLSKKEIRHGTAAVLQRFKDCLNEDYETLYTFPRPVVMVRRFLRFLQSQVVESDADAAGAGILSGRVDKDVAGKSIREHGVPSLAWFSNMYTNYLQDELWAKFRDAASIMYTNGLREKGSVALFASLEEDSEGLLKTISNVRSNILLNADEVTETLMQYVDAYAFGAEGVAERFANTPLWKQFVTKVLLEELWYFVRENDPSAMVWAIRPLEQNMYLSARSFFNEWGTTYVDRVKLGGAVEVQMLVKKEVGNLVDRDTLFQKLSVARERMGLNVNLGDLARDALPMEVTSLKCDPEEEGCELDGFQVKEVVTTHNRTMVVMEKRDAVTKAVLDSRVFEWDDAFQAAYAANFEPRQRVELASVNAHNRADVAVLGTTTLGGLMYQLGEEATSWSTPGRPVSSHLLRATLTGGEAIQLASNERASEEQLGNWLQTVMRRPALLGARTKFIWEMFDHPSMADTECRQSKKDMLRLFFPRYVREGRELARARMSYELLRRRVQIEEVNLQNLVLRARDTTYRSPQTRKQFQTSYVNFINMCFGRYSNYGFALDKLSAIGVKPSMGLMSKDGLCDKEFDVWRLETLFQSAFVAPWELSRVQEMSQFACNYPDPRFYHGNDRFRSACAAKLDHLADLDMGSGALDFLLAPPNKQLCLACYKSIDRMLFVTQNRFSLDIKSSMMSPSADTSYFGRPCKCYDQTSVDVVAANKDAWVQQWHNICDEAESALEKVMIKEAQNVIIGPHDRAAHDAPPDVHQLVEEMKRIKKISALPAYKTGRYAHHDELLDQVERYEQEGVEARSEYDESAAQQGRRRVVEQALEAEATMQDPRAGFDEETVLYRRALEKARQTDGSALDAGADAEAEDKVASQPAPAPRIRPRTYRLSKFYKQTGEIGLSDLLGDPTETGRFSFRSLAGQLPAEDRIWNWGVTDGEELAKECASGESSIPTGTASRMRAVVEMLGDDKLLNLCEEALACPKREHYCSNVGDMYEYKGYGRAKTANAVEFTVNPEEFAGCQVMYGD